MKPTWLTVVSLFSATAFAARKPPDDIFSTYHAKQVSGGSMKLDETSFQDITAAPRNHTAVITLTAMDARFGCKMCTDFDPEWQLLARSWVKGDSKGQSRLLFGTLDFLDGKQIFQALQLQTAPVIMLYPPTVGPNAKADAQPARFDFSMGPETAENIRAWIGRQMPPGGPRPQIKRPINWVRIIAIVTTVLGGVTAFYVAHPYLMPIINSRNLWAALSIIGILLFTSGHMFNHIRGAPYIAGDGKGGITYFAGGFQNQFGLESQIIAGIYALLAFATISLAVKVPRIQDPKTQQAAVFIWAAVMYGGYSFLLSIFRTKNREYPFWLPPF